ncbi:hypothetical protein SSX86_000984 [Deinandra increscens subsp. villosa]|uniref:Uncharacterized protein n=1 Tax=Deinandra increscens subsp. villosa TaxID=3103831 RepID=A0AAP0DY66_9ASTR
MDFVANIRGVVGVGDTISFWQDPWLLSGALKDHYPALYSIEKKKSATVQQRLQNLNNSRTPKWQWNKNTLTLEETSLSDQLSYLITRYDFIIGPDRWQWLGNNDLTFSTSSVRKILDVSRYTDLNLEK